MPDTTSVFNYGINDLPCKIIKSNLESKIFTQAHAVPPPSFTSTPLGQQYSDDEDVPGSREDEIQNAILHSIAQDYSYVS